MPSYGVTISDTASPFFRRLRTAEARKTYAPAIGEAGTRGLRDHFAVKESQSTAHATAAKLGARTTGLFADFARATNWRPSGAGVMLTVSHVAARQRYQGGDILPTKKYLTIPASAASYGKRAREFGEALKFGFAYNEDLGVQMPALIAAKGAAVIKTRRKAGALELYSKRVKAGVYYWLVRGVHQDGDESVLPTDEALIRDMEKALDGWFDGILNGEANG